MPKFYGAIGFAETVEDPEGSGIWKEDIVERMYYGDIIRQTVHNENSEYLNDNFTVNNEISVVADSFLLDDVARIRYVTFLGSKWSIRSVSVEYPRLILSIGGVYNGRDGPGETGDTSEGPGDYT